MLFPANCGTPEVYERISVISEKAEALIQVTLTLLVNCYPTNLILPY